MGAGAKPNRGCQKQGGQDVAHGVGLSESFEFRRVGRAGRGAMISINFDRARERGDLG
jgi:hypothetical protein